MSLQSNVLYLAALADKAKTKVEPLVEEFQKLQTLKTEIIDELTKEVAKIEEQIALLTSQGNELIGELEASKAELIEKINTQVEKATEAISNSIEESIETAVKDIDGISVSIDVTPTSITPVITPELINLTTDFVKNTIVDPTTVAIVSTTVVGTAGGDPIVGGTGTTLAKLTTT